MQQNPLSSPTLTGYEIQAELGRGGMGIVYRAYDCKRQKSVALKTMQGIEPAALYRFKQEFRSLAGLAHPNLVTLYELVSDGREWFFTMELIDGVNILDYVRTEQHAAPEARGSENQDAKSNEDSEQETVLSTVGPYSPGESAPVSCSTAVGLSPRGVDCLREVLHQLASGILALHEAGKLHRDIKPGNVMVTRQGRVILLDFGLAAELDRSGLHQSTEAHLLGSIAYMAPEQAASLPLSPASDWYAVGVILYEALTGKLPIGGSPLQVLTNKQQIDPPPPSSLVPDVPPDLESLAVELLSRRPEARPTGRALLQRLAPPQRAGSASDSQREKPAPTLPARQALLIGRQRHLDALLAAFQSTRTGTTVAVRVHGPSGAGKSTLVRTFLEHLGESKEVVILEGRCYEQEAVPYKALDSLIDALSRFLTHLKTHEVEALLPRDVAALVRVFPVLRRVAAVARAPQRPVNLSDPQEVRRRALAALRELLGRLGERRPLVLFIDDLQWGDVDSATLLTELLRPPDAPLLLLLFGYRSEDSATSPCLQWLLDPPESVQDLDWREVAVGPLSTAESRDLVVALLEKTEAVPDEQAQALAEEAGGNPFFLQELVQHMHEAKEAPRREPLSLGDVLWQRIQQLPGEARRILEAVAVAGRPLQAGEACQAAGLASEDLAPLLQLRSAHLVRSAGPAEGNAIETYHDRIRETITARLPPAALEEYHHRLAAVLQQSGQADAERLAIHFEGAHDLVKAANYYAQAAAQAADALAFERAAKLYQHALQLQGPGSVQERELRTRLGDALANAGRGAESARVYLAAAAGAAPSEALELQRRAAMQLLISGHVDEGLATLRTVLAAVGMTLPATPRRAFWALVWRRLQLRLRGLSFHPRSAQEVPAADLARINICWSAAAGLSVVDTIQGAYFQTRGLLLALAAGEPYHLARALAVEAAHVSIGGSFTRTRTERLLAAADGLARQVSQPYPQAMVQMSRGIAAAFEGEWRLALALCDQAEKTLRNCCTGVAWELSTAHRFEMWPLMFMGDVPEMARRLPMLLQEAHERDDLYAVTNLTLVVGTFARLAADEPERAWKDMEQVMARWSRQGFHVQHMNAMSDEAQIDLYRGEGEGEGRRAWDRLNANWPILKRSHFFRVQQVRIFLLDLRARCALAAAQGAADARPFLRAAEQDAQRLMNEQIPWAGELARLVRAELAVIRGQPGAAEMLRKASAGFAALDMLLHAAAARHLLGRVLGGADGQALIDGAESWMKEHGIRNPIRFLSMLTPAGSDHTA